MKTLAEPFLCDILVNLRDPEAVKAIALDPRNLNPAPWGGAGPSWNDLSLVNGYPSLLLLFSTFEQQGLVDSSQRISHGYVLKIKEGLESQGLPSDLSLFGGLGGICFALQQASLGGIYYQKIIKALQIPLLDALERLYLEPLNDNQRHCLPSSPRLYDPIQGVSGIGRYALENLESPPFQRATEKIAKALVALSQPLNYNGQTIPGWFLSPGDSLNARNLEKYPKGTFNLGLAHGVTGILAFLSIATLKGIQVDGQKEAIERIADWIRRKSIIQNDAIMWPYHIGWEEEVEGKETVIQGSKDAWCYGVPGIARTLFLAGKALGDEALKTFAIQAFKGIFSRKQSEWNLAGPTLCHGISGLLLITHEMSKETGCEDLILRKAELEERLLSYYQEKAPWGFKDIETCRTGKQCEIDKPGFLEGATGILLTLLSLSNPIFKWHLPLLIHE